MPTGKIYRDKIRVFFASPPTASPRGEEPCEKHGLQNAVFICDNLEFTHRNAKQEEFSSHIP